MKLPIVSLTTFIALTCLIGFSTVAYAVDAPTTAPGQALEIAPPVLNLTADPGQVIDAQISLRDVSPVSLIITSEVNDFIADPNSESGSPKILLDSAEPTPYSLISWVAPLPQMTLKPKQIENLPIKITVPKNAAPGGYYGTVRFTAKAADINDTGVSLSASLGALIMIRVNGNASESMKMSDFYVSKNNNKGWFFDSLPITFTERTTNTGNVFEQPRGNILIKDVFGKTIANVNVNLESRNVLPQSTRKFEQEFTAHDLGNVFMFGPYTAELTLDYGNHQKLTSTTSFWVLPWQWIVGALVLLIVLILLSRLALKQYNERLVGRSRSSRRR